MPGGYEWLLDLALFLFPTAPSLGGSCVDLDGPSDTKPHDVSVLGKKAHVDGRLDVEEDDDAE